MNAMLDPIVFEFETTAQEESYLAWVMAKARALLEFKAKNRAPN